MSRKIVLTLSFCLTLLASTWASAQEVSESIDVTAEMAKDLDNSNWTGISGLFFNSKSSKGITNSSAMVFGFSDGQLYYLSKINPVLDKLINKGAGGLCVKSEPRRVEFFKDSKTGKVSGLVNVPKLNKKTGQRSYAKIKLEHVILTANATQLKILDWEISLKEGKKTYIPTRYNLSKTDLTSVTPLAPGSKAKPSLHQIAKALRIQLDDCLKEKPWLK